jgi:pilus assembly protein CpaB
MKPKTMVLMVVAVACGLGASYMTSKLLAERNNKEQAESTVPVLVAKARVNSWQPIREPERFFEIRQYPQSVAPRNALADFPEIKDQRLNKPLEEGKPVSKEDLLTKEQLGIAERLLPGQRALAIKVTAESLVGGFVLPGTRVDVLMTTRGNDGASRIILQNMLVLAVDTTSERASDQKTILGQTVTLGATPEEATRLSLAQAHGELRLLLKSGGDSSRTYNVVSRLRDLDRPLNAERKEEDDPNRSAPTVPALPEIKDDPKPAPTAEVEKKPEPPRRKRWVMKIETGPNVEKATFLLGQKNDEDEDEAPPAPAKKEDGKDDKAKPEATKPAPPPPSAPVTPPSPFGKSMRTGRIR